MSSAQLVIKSKPQHVFRGLLAPKELGEWWGCVAVVDARPGGIWVGGWGEGADGLGQGTVLMAELPVLDKDKRVALKIGDTVIAFILEPDAQGTKLTVDQQGFPSTDPAEEKAALQSWVDAATNLKAYVEKHHLYTPPAPKPTPQARPSASPGLGGGGGGVGGGVPGMPAGGGGQAVDPYGGVAAMEGGDYRVLDDAGFGVTNPHAVIKSWSKEQGFGYVTHKELGDVVFDYDGCDFEPAVGDEVVLLVLGKRFDGKPKVKRIACPAKGSKLKR